jgi:transcriptional regulator GlxA family with amidase domain
VPGGIGTRREAANPALLEYIRAWAAPSSGLQLCMSVCTGAALLAAAGALDGRRATSNKRAFDWVKSVNPRVDWVRSARWVRDGNFVTSSGVSAGADMAVHVLKEVLGAEVAAKAAQYAEYIPATDADKDPFADEAFLPAV